MVSCMHAGLDAKWFHECRKNFIFLHVFQVHDYGCLIQEKEKGEEIMSSMISMLKVLIITKCGDYIPSWLMQISFLLIAKKLNHPVWKLFKAESEKFNEEYGERSLGRLAQSVSPSTSTSKGNIDKFSDDYLLFKDVADLNDEFMKDHHNRLHHSAKFLELDCPEIQHTSEWLKRVIRQLREGNFVCLQTPDRKNNMKWTDYQDFKSVQSKFTLAPTTDWRKLNAETSLSNAYQKIKDQITEVNWSKTDYQAKDPQPIPIEDIWTDNPRGYFEFPPAQAPQVPGGEEKNADVSDVDMEQEDENNLAEDLAAPPEAESEQDVEQELPHQLPEGESKKKKARASKSKKLSAPAEGRGKRTKRKAEEPADKQEENASEEKGNASESEEWSSRSKQPRGKAGRPKGSRNKKSTEPKQISSSVPKSNGSESAQEHVDEDDDERPVLSSSSSSSSSSSLLNSEPPINAKKAASVKRSRSSALTNASEEASEKISDEDAPASKASRVSHQRKSKLAPGTWKHVVLPESPHSDDESQKEEE